MLTIIGLWKLAFSRQNSNHFGRFRTFITLLSLSLQAKFSKSSAELMKQQLEGFTVFAYSYPTLVELYTDIFIKQLYRFNSESSNPFIMDCGSNIGLSVLYFKKLYPQSEVWAFEANPDAFILLQRNVEANKLSGVRLFNCVLTNSSGEIDFYIPAQKAGLNGSLNPNIAKGQLMQLPACQLSELLPAGKTVDFVKIDVEGAEFEVLQDLSDSDKIRYIDQLVLELHGGPHDVQQKFRRLLSHFETTHQHTAVGDQYTIGIPHLTRIYRQKQAPGAGK